MLLYLDIAYHEWQKEGRLKSFSDLSVLEPFSSRATKSLEDLRGFLPREQEITTLVYSAACGGNQEDLNTEVTETSRREHRKNTARNDRQSEPAHSAYRRGPPQFAGFFRNTSPPTLAKMAEEAVSLFTPTERKITVV